jgi:hypothetical protein
MAYDFASGTTQYLSASNPVSQAPLTISAWAKFNATSGNRAVVCLNQNSGTNRFVLYSNGSNLSFFVNSAAGFAQPGISGVNSTNTWYHCCAVEESSTSRYVYLNGTASTQNTTDRTPSGINAINIGVDVVNNSASSVTNGQVGEVGVWNVALTAAEIASLAKGVTCDKVRPQSLVFYAPLVRELIDVRGGRTITNNNTATVAVHPRVYT